LTPTSDVPKFLPRIYSGDARWRRMTRCRSMARSMG
jgi:hypothetical protein